MSLAGPVRTARFVDQSSLPAESITGSGAEKLGVLTRLGKGTTRNVTPIYQHTTMSPSSLSISTIDAGAGGSKTLRNARMDSGQARQVSRLGTEMLRELTTSRNSTRLEARGRRTRLARHIELMRLAAEKDVRITASTGGSKGGPRRSSVALGRLGD